MINAVVPIIIRTDGPVLPEEIRKILILLILIILPFQTIKLIKKLIKGEQN